MDAFTTFLLSIRDTAPGVQALATNLDLLVLAVPPNSASPIIEEHTDRQPRPGDIQIRHALMDQLDMATAARPLCRSTRR